MNIKDLKDSLPYLTQAQLTPFIWGHAGIGKTSVVKQFANEMGYKFFAFYLGTQSDLGDVLGLQDFVRNSEGTAIATTFAPPDWIREVIDYCNKNPDSGAIIFLDEFNRARRDILNGMFSLALDKRFHTLQLPTNCHLIAAGNPPTDEYFTTDVDETALMARFAHIKLEPTFNEWVKFAEGRQFESTLVEFLKSQPDLLSEKHSEFNLPVKVDNRSWERLDKLFNVNTPKHLLEQLMTGIIGVERTVAYREYLKNAEKPLTAAEVLKGKRFDMLKVWSNPDNTQSAILNVTVDALEKHITKMHENKKTFTDAEAAMLIAFYEIAPKDITFKMSCNLVKVRNQPMIDLGNHEKFGPMLAEITRVSLNKPKEAV